jgi:hypothetical protein
MSSDNVKEVISVPHTACVGDTRNNYRILTWKCVGKKHFGMDILWRRCNGANYGSKEVGCDDGCWIQFAKFRVYWLVLVNMVMKIRLL